jgi:hypothetical protein
MKPTEVILIACMAMFLAGCILRGAGKNAKAVPPAPSPIAIAPPAAPPPPLSIPQTNVELPKPQALDPEALVTVAPPPEPPPETAALPRSPKRPTGAGSTPPPKPEAQAQPADTPPPQPQPERPPIQEIIPAAEQKRLLDSIQHRKADIAQMLDQIKTRGLTSLQQGVVGMINSFVNQADEAAKNGDLRSADAQAERAQVLAKELQGGK